MTEEEKKDLEKELDALCEKYGLSAGAFCATALKEDKFIGYLCFRKKEVKEIMMTLLNVGRLWQHSKSVNKRIFEDFERGEGS